MAKIMVIEDDSDLREFFQTALKLDGHEVVEAANGQEGMQMLSTPTPPDLIIVDWSMPVMGGEDFLIEREKSSPLIKIPVLVLSGMDKVEVAATNVQFIKKPVNLNVFLELVAKAIT